MTFTEFLEAMNEEVIAALIRASSFKKLALVIDKIDQLWRQFLIVGGMPEAVKTFKKTNDYKKVAAVHRSIIQTYRSDFPKYGTDKTQVKVEKIFEIIHNHLGEKIKYSELSSIGA